MTNEIYDKMSNAEKEVADFLTEFSIWWVYEQPVIVKDEGDRQRNYYPDFYLADFGVYVEVCGAERKRDYERRQKIYKKNHIPVIFVHTYKGSRKWKPFLIDNIAGIQTKRDDMLLDALFEKIFNDRP